ncbi:MAG: crossover junction endodeoxyribonuclease RuvC [Sphingobacteriales bacterium]|jgi:crossover junction endodeoxyribonuclease RuvC|nr:MAG: crossover junction endodeoxyribonuclease RuvC [Sphingobacteriales bacterium]
MTSKSTITILGIDPGTKITGYGIISSNTRHAELLLIGSIYTEKYDDHYDKLSRIYDEVLQIINIYKPDVLAIEAPFYANNVQSMLKLGRAQGMAIAAALSKKIPVQEYSPKKIKQSITGNGNAAKEQVAAMLCQILKTDALPKQLDATDGLAVAMCHHFSLYGLQNTTTKKYSGWQSFIKDNPKRII